MLDRERLARNGRAGALLFVVAFLGLSLGGYDPADPPGRAFVDSGSPATRNPCGPVGAMLADAAFQAFGLASFGLVWGLLVFDVALFRRRKTPDAWLRVTGLVMVLSVASALLRRYGGDLHPCPPVGPGGYVGALAVAFLQGQLGPAGMLLILAAIGLVGLSLCADALLVWPFAELGSMIRPRRRASAPAPQVAEPRPSVMPAVVTRELPAPAPRVEAPRPALPRSIPSATNLPAIATRRPVEGAKAIPSAPEDGSFVLPPWSLLDPPAAFPVHEHESLIHQRALLLEKTLLEFGCSVRVVQIDTGPVITQFEIELEAGLRVAKINTVANDLAIALAVPSVRIVSPIPGKTTVGIEVPNERRAMVKLGEVIQGVGDRLHKSRIPLFLGKDVKGAPLAFDLAEMPHLLIAGRTGTGKSVCLNAMILSILMTRRPDEVKLILIDPKMVELSQFKRVPHLMHPVVTDMKKAESLLRWACDKMDERYGFLARAGVRNVQAYNALGPDEIYNRLRPEDDEEAARIPTFMPSIVIVADEMADLMMTAAKEVEEHIVRLAQKARAAGIHLILATQRPTVDVITGLIKGNMPARIAFQVTSRNDSRVVLDEMGADKLLGNGDMLFLIPGTSHIIRSQGTYVSDSEVTRVCEYLQQYPVEFSRELVQMQVGGGKEKGAGLKERDDLYEPAIEVVIREGRGSCSLLQRALGIGYGRAARLIDFMAEDGIVGEYKSGSAREVLYSWEEWESLKGDGEPGEAAA